MQTNKLQLEIANLKDGKHNDLASLESKHKNEYVKEQSKHADDIQRFKIESEKILKETQKLLLEQFENDKQDLIRHHQASIDLLNKEKNILQNELKTLQQQLNERSTRVQDLEIISKKQTVEINESNAKIIELESKIQELNNVLKTKVNSYDNLLMELKVCSDCT